MGSRYRYCSIRILDDYYRVPATATLRYLGFFFDSRLTWTHHVDVVCNKARATLKALQLLGNSVRGLDQARWRLAYNAICLPVLTYGCQLWFTGKQVTLVKKLQVVQNEANTALRLYRAPRDSQLLKRLGGEWHVPTPGELPLPTPNRQQAKTTLRTLAARVPINGPRIDLFPDVPTGAPYWNGRVQIVPKRNDWDYAQVTTALVETCRKGRATNIFCEGIVSNQNREDGKQIGTASAVLYHRGIEYEHLEATFGESVTETDTLTRSLGPAFDTLTLLLAAEPEQANILTNILIPSGAALNKVLDASPHEEQEVSLRHLAKLSEILTTYPNAHIRLQWLPRKGPSDGFRRAKQHALEAIRTTDIATLNEPQTIKQQKENTNRKAMTLLTERWHQNPRTSHAYRTALLEPPDGKHHPTFQPSRPKPTSGTATRDNTPTRPKAKFKRLTHATLYRFITGHAFTGEYTQRFYPQHTPDQVACPCGSPIQTVEHVLMLCPSTPSRAADISLSMAAPDLSTNSSTTPSASETC
ncbi:hypothetical protein BGY98DRAFT_1086401 [Russula aff. rugulosa BPL654]|nr:hypothetical protein BGY98DRAFT_1086401 [Russula aff. rugulosa BPL654]